MRDSAAPARASKRSAIAACSELEGAGSLTRASSRVDVLGDGAIAPPEATGCAAVSGTSRLFASINGSRVAADAGASAAADGALAVTSATGAVADAGCSTGRRPIHTATASTAVAEASGTIHRQPAHQGWPSALPAPSGPPASGALRTNAASVAWHRPQSATCASTSPRSSLDSSCSAYRASTSASGQSLAGTAPAARITEATSGSACGSGALFLGAFMTSSFL